MRVSHNVVRDKKEIRIGLIAKKRECCTAEYASESKNRSQFYCFWQFLTIIADITESVNKKELILYVILTGSWLDKDLREIYKILDILKV